MAALRSHLEFRSDAFPARPGEEGVINPGRWGAALADYLTTALAARGFTSTGVYAEDWGYRVDLENPAFRLWLGCGNYEEYPGGFLCFIEPSKPYIRRWLRKVDTTARVNALADALETVLLANPRVRELRWWSDSKAPSG